MTTTRPMTFAEAAGLPEPAGFRYELHHAELVQLPIPNMTHMRVRRRLRILLENAAKDAIVETEFGFRALPEFEFRRADVAYVSTSRWEDRTADDYFHGAPDLAIEILSPSNSASEMRDNRKLCLTNGAVEFWVVDPAQREVEVYTRDGRSVTYGPGQQIPLFFAGSGISVDSIFA